MIAKASKLRIDRYNNSVSGIRRAPLRLAYLRASESGPHSPSLRPIHTAEAGSKAVLGMFVIPFFSTLLPALITLSILGPFVGFCVGVGGLIAGIVAGRRILKGMVSRSMKGARPSFWRRLLIGSLWYGANIGSGAGAGAIYLHPGTGNLAKDREIVSGVDGKPYHSPTPYPLNREAADKRHTAEETANLIKDPKLFSLQTPDGGKITYSRDGNPQGKTIVLISGVPGDIFYFYKLIPNLAPDFDVVAINLFGDGQSNRTCEKDFDFSFPAQAEALRFAIQTLGLKNVTLLGYSWGGTKVNDAVLRLGVKELGVDRVIYLNALGLAFLPDERQPYGGLEFLTAGNRLSGPLMLRTFSGLPGLGVKDSFGGEFRRTDSSQIASLAETYARTWTQGSSGPFLDPEVARGIFSHWYAHLILIYSGVEYPGALGDRLGEFKGIPILVMTGGKDGLLYSERDQNPTAYGERMFQAANRWSGHEASRHVDFPNDGHMLPLENPEGVAEAIRSFIAGLK